MRFREAFRQLPLSSEMEKEVEDLFVDRVAVSDKNKEITVFISADKPVKRKTLNRLSLIMLKEIFHSSVMKIRFEERYDFSKLSISDIYHMNETSLMEELAEESELCARIFKKCNLIFLEEGVTIESEDSFMARVKLNEIKEWLEVVFKKRYGKEAEFCLHFIESREEEETDPSLDMDFIRMEDLHRLKTDEKSVEKKEPFLKEKKKERNRTGLKELTFSPKKSEQKPFRKKLPEDPDLLYGKNFEGEPIPLSDIQEEIGDVVVKGKIIKIEERETRSEKIIFTYFLTDFTDSIKVKLFVNMDRRAEMKDLLKEGMFVKLKGIALMDKFDREIGIGSVSGIKKIKDFTSKRSDDSEKKRVELHLHTLMSEMDAIINPKTLLKTLSEWGHTAVAITDSGVVQSFTKAYHAKKALEMKEFKLIYGMEAFMVDDISPAVRNCEEQTVNDTAVVFDIETTGFGPKNCRIIEIGAVKVKDGKVIDKFSSFVNPQTAIPEEITKLTSITEEMVLNEPEIEVILPQFLDFCRGAILVAHNASFDTSFIFENMRRMGLSGTYAVLDTVRMARILLGGLKNYKLDTVAEKLGISLEHHHRAVDDAACTAEIYIKLCALLSEKYGNDLLSNLNRNPGFSSDIVKKMATHKATILAKNDIGRINLYRLVSGSHLDTFMRRPRIKKSELVKYREGLLVGSGCESGELYQAVLRRHGEDEIKNLAEFYDYLEIQPTANNSFMIDSEKVPDITGEEDLRDINRRIVRIGEMYGKPVVATGDAHFIHPEEEIFRKIIINANGAHDVDRKTPLYLRTTEEMLEEFAYLGREKAYEVVVTNTNLIADRIENIAPVRPDKCPPVIENSDEELRSICVNRAKEIYGENLPEPVKKRMDHELDSIIKNGFAVMYIISQKLVWKSNEDGYLVGSRGSVGSSFVAFLSGITEVNSLSAHYYCECCHFTDFDSEEVKAYSGKSGCDMPDRLCPVCGKPLLKDGHDIPFETFLGFNGDKEPDIDLNFSGEYQAKAHAYTEVIFGEGQTFRAGTIGGVAEKTAYGYVLKYMEERDLHFRKSEIERLALGCIDVRRTTGQHPGGIVVLPLGEDICSFSPIQHPANDMNTPIITTHFDYHSIDHNLLKLDILGHDDPTMIRMLEDITGVDAKTIRLDDEKVLSLFLGLEVLGIQPEDINGYDLGSLGVPEFGTDFVMQMLRDTKPQSFSDLVRISGLSHGTDVWLDNAQKLITEGKCTISSAICTRDDIMIYLIHMGVNPGLSFKIMESVRKGKGLTPEMEAAMVEKNVPDWYIWSCKKIKYMFPKAHAAAYVMMGFRIAYFKVYHPLAYYTAFFSIRADAFDYEKFCQGKEKLMAVLQELGRIKKDKTDGRKLSKKEEDILKDGHIVLEMYARGFEFLPMDIYRAKPKQFQILDGKIMPALNTVEGLGDKAAYALYEAAKNGPFLSKFDLKTRVKGFNQTTMEKMSELGILKDLPETNQISFLDYMGKI